ncbi:MAG: tetrahydromethanopterin S-methyltransferase subunit F [Methanosarcinales archaeon]|nr:MAG: tetrahydromethanopterin S-methyltransferase subunit F [Methanosarcinales archaeon]
MAEEEKIKETVEEATDAAEVAEEVSEESPVEEAGELIAYDIGTPMVVDPFMEPFEASVKSIRRRAQLIARNQKLDSGFTAGAPIGVAAGILFALILVLAPILWM